MEISLIADTVTVAATQVLGFAKFQALTSNNIFSVHDSSSDQPSSPGGLQISAVIFPFDAVAPPPVKPYYLKAAPRTLVRKRNRTRRKSLTGGDDEDGEDGGFFGGDGPFGGGGGGGGGRWNFDEFGGSDWEESSASWSDPAFDFVYEVISWIAFSNCLHYAFKKVLRIVADDRDKAPLRFSPI